MLLALGHHHFDVTFRAIVVGILDGRPQPGEHHLAGLDDILRHAEQLVAQGADALEFAPSSADGADGVREVEAVVAGVAALHQRFGVAVAVRTDSASVARAGFAAGAVLAHEQGGLVDPDYLAVVAGAGASVLVTQPGTGPGRAGPEAAAELCGVLGDLARRAEAAGIPSARIVLGLGDLDPTMAASQLIVRDCDGVAALGWPLALSTSEVSVADAAHARLAADAAHAVGVLRGVRVLRTREVRAARRVAEVMGRLLEAHDAARAEAA